VALLFSPVIVTQAAPPTHCVPVWIYYNATPVYTAIFTITYRESQPDQSHGHTGPDGIYLFQVWPNVNVSLLHI